MSEYAFELALCATLEGERDAVVARQLGGGVAEPGGRVLDAVLVEPGPQFEERAAITRERIPRAAIEADVGPGRFRPITDAVAARPDRARAIAERAADVGFWELERRSGDLCARQVARYPENWFGAIVGVENKPDLECPGALYDQLRTDASLALCDRVVLATESYVTGAHLNRIPESVGVWRFHRDGGRRDGERTDDERIEVVREPEQLAVDEHGVELLERLPGRAAVEIAEPAAKSRARRRIAERAYGKGWRPDELPPCANAVVERAAADDATTIDDAAATANGDAATADGDAATPESACVPYCRWHERIVDAATDCGPDCAGYEQAAPPEADAAAERDARSPWVADPDGRQRRQIGLDRFG